MPRTNLWRQIEADLKAEISSGHYRPGDKLPTEAALSERFDVNRHTVRRALAELAEQGLVVSRRGSGVFVTAEPTDYPVSRRTRFSQNIAALGQSPQKRVLRLETRFAEAEETRALALPDGAQVHIYEGVGLSDDLPLTHFRSIFPAAALPRLLERLERDPSVTAALKGEGIADYIRVSTRITAEIATPLQARHLMCREGSALIQTISLNHAAAGWPIEYGLSWFAADRVQLLITPET